MYKIWLETLLKYTNQSIIVVDKNANIQYYSGTKKNVFGVDENEMMGENLLNVLDSLSETDSTIFRVLKTGESIVDYVQTFINKAQKRVTAVTTTVPLYKDNEIIGAIEIIGDANNYKEISKKLAEIQKSEHFRTGNNVLEISNGAVYSLKDIIGSSNAITEIKNKIYKVADSSSPVFVYGETGTGKELVVQAIHNASFKRKDKPFIAQNCAAIPNNLLESILFGTAEGSFTGSKNKPGLFEIADGGTLLLDEINSMDLELQAKLLRVLQTGEIRRVGGNKTLKLDVRIMATSNIDPMEAVKTGIIRQDLYYRLNVVSFFVPPLKDRPEDIEVIFDYYINYYNEIFDKKVIGITDECMNYLKNYEWPGNIRELRSTIENLMNFVEGGTINIEDLPINMKINKNVCNDKILEELNVIEEVLPLRDVLEKTEKDMIKRALNQANGNQAKAAKLLCIPRQTLYNKIIKHNIKGNFYFE